eukprot:TRINITY_DN2343_c0_g1_i1.p1 TRINITY_DN2343_c0_g1~~TRINITY_DN2343_c0_g1_i1.p1  ORF type:complete len:246 (+),score=30.04 TRINITY_DN2343_c0_g1_i1:127-864(+)
MMNDIERPFSMPFDPESRSQRAIASEYPYNYPRRPLYSIPVHIGPENYSNSNDSFHRRPRNISNNRLETQAEVERSVSPYNHMLERRRSGGNLPTFYQPRMMRVHSRPDPAPAPRRTPSVLVDISEGRGQNSRSQNRLGRLASDGVNDENVNRANEPGFRVRVLNEKERNEPEGGVQAGATESRVSHFGEDDACRICYNRRLSTAFVPCGHSFACLPCAKQSVSLTGKCPVCKASNISIIKIFRP